MKRYPSKDSFIGDMLVLGFFILVWGLFLLAWWLS